MPLSVFFHRSYDVPFQDGKDGQDKATDEEIVRTQIESLLEIMMVQVQDRICTTDGVLDCEPLQLGVHIKEVPVWGIDCYTRRMVELSIEDHAKELYNLKTVHTFIEKRLLPTINAQSTDTAHDMSVALDAIVANPVGPTDAGKPFLIYSYIHHIWMQEPSPRFILLCTHLVASLQSSSHLVLCPLVFLSITILLLVVDSLCQSCLGLNTRSFLA